MAMFQQQEEEKSESREEVERMVEKTPMSLGDPVATLAAGSVLYSWFNFYVRGNKQRGIFIGLWAPTLLAFSNAVRINDISRKVEKGTGNLYDWLTQNG